ncbi:Lrp/AsnC family transcriptional regulator [Planctomycetota bacterium]
MRLDQTDSEIIEILSQQHVPNSVIARKMGLSEGTIRQRIRKLKEAGAVNIKALRDPNVLDNQQLVIVSVTVTEARLLDTKAQEIAELDDVLSVSIVSGQYDLLIEVLVDSNKGLVRFLTESLSSIEGISKTESFVVLKSYNKFV